MKKKLQKGIIATTATVMFALPFTITGATYAEERNSQQQFDFSLIKESLTNAIAEPNMTGEEILETPQGQFGIKERMLSNNPYSTPEKPSVTTHQYDIDGKKGFMDISWKSEPGAISYKVGIFNGHTYDFINVGNVTSWSTKGKKIWATSEEIAVGKFYLKTNGTGEELPIDPTKTYHNAFLAFGNASNDYSSNFSYYVRVIAVYQNGESPVSEAGISIMPLMAIPDSQMYTPVIDVTTGAIELDWQKVVGAKGYKVWIFNGKTYQYFDVGSALEWTTLESGIWPTVSEISQGKTKLHQDGLGTDIDRTPSNLYKYNNVAYAGDDNYYVRVTAYDDELNTIAYQQFNRAKIVEDVESAPIVLSDIEKEHLEMVLDNVETVQSDLSLTDEEAMNLLVDEVVNDAVLANSIDSTMGNMDESKVVARGPIGWTLKAIKAVGWICRLGGTALTKMLLGVSPSKARLVRRYSDKIYKATVKLDKATKAPLIKVLRAAGIPKKDAEIIADFIMWFI